MRFEKSAGVIVFRKTDSGREYLLLQNSSKFFWDFPKGNMDKGETEEEAAARELREEASLTKVKFVPGFKETAEYFYTFGGEKIHKVLVMFLGEETNQEEVKISWEHSASKWASFEEARKILKDKKALIIEEAEKFLSSRLEKWTKKD